MINQKEPCKGWFVTKLILWQQMYKVMICNAVPQKRNAGALLPGTAGSSLRNIHMSLRKIEKMHGKNNIKNNEKSC